ncbi:MAG: Crp/Fnr family transcriptional regulator [Bacteroidetes bacterium]|nr:Crp/Fnr family transcriptional regulator [Bacteroidota bacterium]
MTNRFFHIFDLAKYLRKRKMKKIYKDQLRAYINHIVPITEFDWSLFDQRLYYKEYNKNDLLSETGEVENYIYFIVEGVARICHYKKGVEYTLRFNFPISIFNSYSSFVSRTPSLICVEALTELKLFRMSYMDMQTLYNESPTAERVGRRMVELLYVQREMKELQMHTRTAEDYYNELVKTSPDLIEKIPQKHLASYLGITPESLSRIKKKIVGC